MQTIEIDCAPMTARPDSYLPQVLEGTRIEPRDPVSKFFGCWMWDFSDIPFGVWQDALPIISERLRKLYHRGCIRYASW